MKHLVLIFISIIFFQNVDAQSTIDELVNEGIEYHEQGEYDNAIISYTKALEIDPKSSLVNYELALTYFTKRDYDKAIEHSDVILSQNDELTVKALLIKGSALDMQGKTKESIELFENVIKDAEPNHLLYYNLALNYYKLNDLDNAEKYVIKAIETKSSHASSHLILANIHNLKKNPVQTLLSLHYFLFLEPDTPRAMTAYKMLMSNFSGNVSKGKDSNSVTITLPTPNENDPFSAITMMISLLEASKSYKENRGKTEDEMFVENTDSFFKILGESKKDTYDDLWWSFYVPFFYDISNSGHLESYCKYITQIGNENAAKWLNENQVKLVAFGDWLENY